MGFRFPMRRLLHSTLYLILSERKKSRKHSLHGTMQAMAGSRSCFCLQINRQRMSTSAIKPVHSNRISCLYSHPVVRFPSHPKYATQCRCQQSNSNSLIATIYKSLVRKGYFPWAEEAEEEETEVVGGKGNAGEIFLPNPKHLSRKPVGDTLQEIGWSEDDRMSAIGLPEEKEMKRLITLGITQSPTMKLGRAGISEGFVEGVHQMWSNSEVIKIKCVDRFYRSNMKRIHRLLEIETKGQVVWRAGSSIILYRGKNYEPPYNEILRNQDSAPDNVEAPHEIELDKMLEGLGPRYDDWWGPYPLPVDADLLPPVVPGYEKPPRLLPYGLNAKLTNDEVTCLRRLAQSVPPHFALRKGKNLQGLATSIIKLWERCEIAKIALKQEVHYHHIDDMVKEIKLLTGGSLLSRDMESIVFYRGKDFLPFSIASVLAERKALVRDTDKGVLDSQIKSLALVSSFEENEHVPSDDKLEVSENSNEENFLPVEGHQDRGAATLSSDMILESSQKLADETKKRREEPCESSDASPAYSNNLTEEERCMLSKLGLRMKPFLLLGRRGVFDGIVENMHLHWKYRDLVKIISNDKNMEQVMETAKILERESGGILVAVERVSKGHAIIVYRGRNYKRPPKLRPKTFLLNKKAALRRSIEAQRKECLDSHLLRLKNTVERMKGYREARRLSETSESLRQEFETSPLENKAEYPNCSASMLKSETSAEDKCAMPICYSPNKEARSEPGADENAFNCEKTSIKKDIEYMKAENHSLPYKAVHLSNKQRLILRRQALHLKRPVHFHMGKNNVVPGLIQSICEYFERHPLVIVSVKGRSEGTKVATIASELEEATGGILVSCEQSKVILYRGWLEQKKKPSCADDDDDKLEAISCELLVAIQNECGLGLAR